MRFLRASLSALAVLLSPGVALSSQGPAERIDAFCFDNKPARLDGLLKEWPQLVALSQKLGGSTEATASGLVGYDAESLYVAMKIGDADFQRSQAFAKGEDHAALELSIPLAAGGSKSYTLRFFAGESGKTAGVVKLDGVGTVKAATLVENPSAGGYAFEARLPWSALPAAKTSRSGIRARLVYSDRSAGKSGRIATSAASGDKMPLMTLEGDFAFLRGVVDAKGLNPEPARELVGNITGDAFLERVAVYDRFLVVTGFNYRGGKEFYFKDLELAEPSALMRLELRDVTGDGRAEVVSIRRAGTATRSRDFLEIWQFPSSKSGPRLLLQHEVGIAGDAGHVENSVSFVRAGKRDDVVVSRGKHRGLKVDEWAESVSGGETYPTILPWQRVVSRRYAFEGDAFKQVKETEGKPAMKGPKGGGQRLWSGKSPPQPTARGASSYDPLPAQAAPLKVPRPPSAGELQSQVYDMYRRERRAKGKPSFDFMVNTYGDETPERVLVHGADIVVFGERFREGTTYAYTKLGFKRAGDVLALTAMDLTGDGYAELIVRGVLTAKASKSLGGRLVTRHALYVYKVRADGISRIFAAETGRSLDGNSVLANVAFRPRGGALEIELSPGRVLGWSEENYPFPQDPGPYGGLEPLLLPWGGKGAAAYRFAGETFESVVQ